MSVAYGRCLEGRNHLLKQETKKAISLLEEGKNCFIQDGREVETQWCMAWLLAAYDQAGKIENARAEFRELLAMKNKPTHAILITLHQASPYLKALQNDPQMGKSLGNLLEKSGRLGAKRYFRFGEHCVAMHSPFNFRQRVS